MTQMEIQNSQDIRLGQHIIADFYDAEELFDMSAVGEILTAAAQAADATVLEMRMHDFGPNHGFTGFALLAESHISVHTWPEHGYAAIDIFMCGSVTPDKSLDILRDYFRPKHEHIQHVSRGNGLSDICLKTAS